jgi:hypothetical protein
MPQLSIKIGAIACALGLLTFAGAANAASPIPVTGVAPIAIPVIDERTPSEELERPNQVPPGLQEGATLNVAPQPSTDAPGTNIGDDELQREFPSEEWPPSMRK